MSEVVIRAKSNVTKGITQTNSIPRSLTYKAELLRVIKKQSKFDLAWYATFIAFGFLCLGLFYKEWMIYLTVGELFCALIYQNLVARGRLSGIYVNILDCLMYGVICFLNGAYGEMFKTLVISNAFNVYGIISWSKQGKTKTNDDKKQKSGLGDKKNDELVVKTMSKKMLVVVLVCFAVGAVAAYFALDAINTSLAYIACITFSLNIVCKTLQMSRYKEAWWFSITNSVVSFAMWFTIFVMGVQANDDWTSLPTIGASLAGLTNNIYGLITWSKLYKRSTLNGGAYLAMRPMHISKITKLKRNYRHLVWKEELDHVPTAEEIAMQKRITLASRQGLFQ